MASLGRFISKFGKRALPFFKIMKRSGTFKWTPEADEVFEDLKKYLASPPVMVAPRPGEHLKLYLAATPQTARVVFVAEREEPVLAKKDTATPSPEPPDKEAPSSGPEPQGEISPQENLDKAPEEPSAAPPLTTLVEHPVYFVSTVLRDARERYTMQQKLLLALLSASGCNHRCPSLRGMPIPRQAGPPACTGAPNDPALLALCGLGAGHPRTIPTLQRGLPLPVRRH